MNAFRKERSYSLFLTKTLPITLRMMYFIRRSAQRVGGTKTMRVMQLSAVFLLGICLQVAAAGRSQTVTFSGKDVPLKKVFAVIEQQTGFMVAFSENKLEKAAPVNIHANALPLTDFLELALKNQDLEYSIEANTIFIRKKAEQDGGVNRRLSPSIEIPPITVRGKVVNEKGEPVVASVVVKGTNKGATSNNYGDFSISDVDENASLIISGINIQTQEIKINGRIEINIVCKTNNSPLDEVVFKGYYSTSSRLNTGSVSKVRATEIQNQPVLNPLQAIQGRMPGVEVVQTSGVAGSGFRVKIRGTNSLRDNANNPLYIVDGIPFNSSSLSTTAFTTPVLAESPLNTINPSDIENIEVLKDADATAIYGSRGANGVVLITTKKGKSGKTTVDVNVYGGVGQVSNTMDLLNTQQYLEMRNEAYQNDGATPVGAFARDLVRWDTTRYTNWQKELIGRSANLLNSQVSITGGTTNTQFLIGGNYYRESTVFPGGSGFKRGSGYMNIHHLSDNQKFEVTTSASYSSTTNNLPTIDYTKLALTLPPIAPSLYDADGKINWQLTPGGVNTWTNPLAYLQNTHKSNTDNVIANASLSYTILKGLKIKANGGYTTTSMDQAQKEPLSFYKDLFADPVAFGITGTARYATNSVKTWNLEPQIHYQTGFNSGKLNILLGSTFQETRLEGNSFTASGYKSDALLESIPAAQSISDFINNYTQYRYNAFFGRLGYSLKDKYLVNLTGRRDGSSRFGQDKRFANFGAIGLGWIFTEEDFLNANNSFLSFGKIRGSYGTSGNDQIPDYGYLDSYSSTSYPYQGNAGIIPSRLPNPDFAWEINKKLEVALELGFLNDRILFSTNFYKNRSSNQLVGFSLSGVTGFPSIQYNLPATVQNTGYEFQLFSQNIKLKQFEWSTSINVTIPNTKLISYPNIEGSSYNTIYVVGKPLGIVYKYNYSGVNPQTGLYDFRDINEDGTISYPDDIYPSKVIGQKFYGGFQNKFTFKGFQLDFLFQFSKQTGPNYLISSVFTQPGLYEWSTTNGNQPVQVMARWRKPGDNTNIQMFSQDFGLAATSYSDYTLSSDGGITDASFIRLKNLSLSWQLPLRMVKAMKVQSLRIYLQGQNLLTFTNYIGMDPENLNTSTLPPLRVMTGGIQIIF